MIKNKKRRTNMKKILANKGLYAVLAICLVASGIGTWSSIQKNLLNKIDTSSESTVISTERAVEKKETGVPDERTTEKETQTKKVEESTKIDMAAEYCALPLGTDIVKDYSNGEMVYSKTLDDYRVHNGIDFAGVAGDQVKAIYGGTVTDVYDDVLWGTVVIIDHGSFTAKYCGLQSGSTVLKDEKVEINAVVGILGVVPVESADDSHLHLEVIIDGKNTDPLVAMNKTD